MNCFAAVMTGKGTGAISTIQAFGDSAEAVLKKIFRPAEKKPVKFGTGKILLGSICDGTEVIDRVTLGCEGPETFAIHCHGNPLIVEMIMQLLLQHGANLVTDEQLLARVLTSQGRIDTIAVEAKLALPKVRTIQGAKIIANQIDAGLSKKAQDWLGGMDEASLDEIKAEASRILQESQTARLIMYGCTAVLTGPPNSGKSTLLNCLAGRQKAIVTDIEGTTRDWVSAECRIGSLAVKLIDTAGLDEEISYPQDGAEQAAQKKTVEILEQADIVLLVLDNARPAEELDNQLLERITDKQVIAVLNKSDLSARLDPDSLPAFVSDTVRISAEKGTGIENLKEKIRQASRVVDFDMRQPVCFTKRQENLLKKLKNSKSNQQAASIIRKLLKGEV
ncbi:MAG: GTPase [Planctomycetota bacterium]